jgi:hypothetical protein
MIDEHAPHQAGGDAEKVRTVLPADTPRVRQFQERFIHQRGGLQRVSAPFPAHVRPCEAAQLPLHERYQLLQGVIIAIAPRPQQFADRPGCRFRHEISPEYRSFFPRGWADSLPVCAHFE